MQLTGIERPFGGEDRHFDLSPIGAWRAVESRCGGMGKVIGRLYSQLAIGPTGRTDPLQFDFSGDDIREVILQGLKGGGMADADATRLVIKTFDAAQGKSEFAPLALEIACAWWFGLPEGKTTAPETESEAETAPAASTSAPSMPQVQP